MKASRLANAMSYIDDDLISGAVMDTKNKKTGRWLKWGTAAACVCLLFGTITVFAATDLGTHMIDMFTSRTEPGSDYSESGYVLSADMKKVSANLFSGDIKEVSDIILQQIKDYSSYSSQSPGSWRKKFASSSEARAYIGFSPLQGLDWDLEEQSSELIVTGNEKGEIQALQLETDYQVGDVRLQAFSYIYTDKYENDITYGSVTTEAVEFRESFYTTEHQLQCHVITSTALDSGYMTMDGYLVQDSILYNLHIAYLEKDTEQAEDLLHQWANLFGD